VEHTNSLREKRRGRIVPTVILVAGRTKAYLETEIDKLEEMVRDSEHGDESGCKVIFHLYQMHAYMIHNEVDALFAEVVLPCDEIQRRCTVTITPNDIKPPFETPNQPDRSEIMGTIGAYTQQGQSSDKLVKQIIRSAQSRGRWAEIADLQSSREKCPYSGAVYKYGENDYAEEYFVTCRNCSWMFDTTMRFVDVPEKGQAKIQARCPFCRATYSYTQNQLIDDNSVRCRNCNEVIRIDLEQPRRHVSTEWHGVHRFLLSLGELLAQFLLVAKTKTTPTSQERSIGMK
jgi:predicted Zn finger-like uncharacterized protein